MHVAQNFNGYIDFGDGCRKRNVAGDGFGQNCHQHSLSLYIVAGKQHSKDVTLKCHQHRNSVTKIHKSSPTLQDTQLCIQCIRNQ